MRGKVAKRMRRDAKAEARRQLAHASIGAFGMYPMRTMLGLLTRMRKRLLKRSMKFNIDSINRQTMMSRTEAATRTKKIVWSFGTHDRNGRLRGRGTAVVHGVEVATHVPGTGRKGRVMLNREGAKTRKYKRVFGASTRVR